MANLFGNLHCNDRHVDVSDLLDLEAVDTHLKWQVIQDQES